jgi:aminopeptidase N
MRRSLVALVGCGIVLALAMPPAIGSEPRPGGAGIGDPYFPKDGNGGYRVRHYDIKVRYAPDSGRLLGDAVIAARSAKSMSRFNLDFVLRPLRVTVNGDRAEFRMHGRHELVVVPARPIRADRRLRIEVRYRGHPEHAEVDGGRPWRSPGRPAFVNAEPHSSTIWFPLNDHPSDKATYDVTAVVPRAWKAVSAGRLVGHHRAGKHSAWHWRVDEPMASYQQFLGLGRYHFRHDDRAGLTSLYAWSSGFSDRMIRHIRIGLGNSRSYVRWLGKRLGPYPFHHIGGVVVGGMDVPTIESQSAPVYGRYVFRYGYPAQARQIMVHELAHQWFGASVTIRRWRYLWLQEGFATYLEWWFAAAHGGPSANEQMLSTYRLYPRDAHWWTIPPGDPGPGPSLFRSVYGRGAMTLQGLRNRIGLPDFRRILRTFAREHRYGTATTQQFIRLAERVSGQDLSRFFRVWLFRPNRPAPTVANGFPAT